MTQLSIRTKRYSSQEWNLSDLYKGFDDPKFSQDLQALQQQSAEFRQNYRDKVSQLTQEEVARCLQQLEGFSEKAGQLHAFPALLLLANPRNTQAKQFLDDVKVALTRVDNQLLFFKLELQDLDPAKLKELQASPALQKYRHYLDRIAQFRSHKLPEAVEQTRNRDNLTGRQAFIQLRSVHLGAQEYQDVTTPDGKVARTEAQLDALLSHPDANVRYEAYVSVRQVMQRHNLLYGYILNTVCQDHRIESQIRGYPSTFQKQLVVDEVSESIFRGILEVTEERFDLFQRYYQLKGDAIGQKVRICDLYAPWTANDELPPQLNYATGVGILLEALQQFDIFYANRAADFFSNGWVDATVRAGKRRGACDFPVYGKHCYLLLSYTDDYNSLFTLAREIGHGLHFSYTSDRQSYFNSKPPVLLAEVASTFNKLLLLDYLLEKAGEDKHLRKVLLTHQLEDQLRLLFRQSTIGRLELAIHERAAQGSFDQNFVNEQWMEFYRELCGDAVELLPEHQYDWARISHLYSKPFYCYQYTASNIVSLACYQKYREIGKSFISGYIDLLGTGGSMNQVEALRQYVDVNLEDSATISSALGYVEELIEQLQETL
ncbi:MAG TPA: M3 family metallopeptidase [Allocoleopsis sp.]